MMNVTVGIVELRMAIDYAPVGVVRCMSMPYTGGKGYRTNGDYFHGSKGRGYVETVHTFGMKGTVKDVAQAT
jgi:hypothetical protein